MSYQEPTAAQPANLSAATSAANTSQAPVVPGAARKRVTIDRIMVFASAAGNATVTLTDGVTTINLGTLALTTAALILLVSASFAIGASVTITIGAAGVGITTTVSAAGELSADQVRS